MSNTSEVSPYRDDRSTTDISVSLDETMAALAEAFSHTDAERQVLERYREEVRSRQLKAAHVSASLMDNDQLLSAASSLGYAPRGGTDAAALRAGKPIELVGPGGASVLLHKKKDRLALMSATGAIGDIVRANTVLSAQQHLARIGKVSKRVLASGDVELSATETKPAGGAAANITMTIGKSGESIVDIECVKGSRCEALVRDVAAAVGGEVRNVKLKDSYYAAPPSPGEPTHVKPGS